MPCNPGELLTVIAELKQLREAEAGKRQQLESSLQQATSLFQRDMAAKDEELTNLRAHLG